MWDKDRYVLLVFLLLEHVNDEPEPKAAAGVLVELLRDGAPVGSGRLLLSRGLTLADLLRAEAAEGIRSSNKAIINIHLSGGPSHQDMFDLKPDTPKEVRGEFNPIQTNDPSFGMCD